MISVYTLAILIVTCIILNIMVIYSLSNKNSSQLSRLTSMIFILLLVWIISLILQATIGVQNNINPIIYDYFAYIGICFLPVYLFMLSVSFSKTKVKFTKKYLLLFVVPVISLILLWTNNKHHLFYVKYYLQ